MLNYLNSPLPGFLNIYIYMCVLMCIPNMLCVYERGIYIRYIHTYLLTLYYVIYFIFVNVVSLTTLYYLESRPP